MFFVPRQVPAAAVTIMSHLICYCSIAAAAACIWYIDILATTLFGVASGVINFHPFEKSLHFT
jgi:hypothetical protein